MRPEHALRNWLKANNMKQCEFASRIKVDRSTVTLWVQGKRRPWPAYAELIAKATKNKIPVHIWNSAA